MFCLDLETVSVESTSAILSLGCCYHDGESSLSYQSMMDTGFFVKFDLIPQFRELGRTKEASTLEWWKKQGRIQQETNLIPSPSDIPAREAIALFSRWVKKFPSYRNDIIWVRGSMDQSVLESMCRALGVDSVMPYNQYRDVRTAVDILYPEAKGGYVDVDPEKVPDFDRNRVLSHHPLHDAARDLCMLLGGKS